MNDSNTLWNVAIAFLAIWAILLSPWLYFVLATCSLRFAISWRLKRFFEKLQWTFTSWLPRWVICLAAVRLIAETTSGKYSNTDVNDVRAATCIRRWADAS